jgi:Domain of unknown function (DUF4394)
MQIQLKTIQSFASLLAGIFLFSSCQKEVSSFTEPQSAIAAKAAESKVMEKGTAFYALTATNELIKYTTGRPLTELGSIAITNLAMGEKILAIDFRPATGQLYGVSDMSRLYIINHISGRATAVGAALFSPAINGTRVALDFNPTVDRIRLVTDNKQNLRLHPETGTVAATDGAINPGDPEVVAVAYTNSFAGASATTLYDIDVASNKLYKQNPPNNGTLELVGSLGVEASGEGGFDISPDNSLALAVLFGRGEEDGSEEESPGNKYRFYYINLQTGEATNAGKVDREIIGLAIPTTPVAYAVSQTNNLIIFNPEQAGSMITKSITGLQMGESVLGIDMRPATGQLFALGSSSRIYIINTANGAATVVGGAFTPALSGTSFGFDFNPTVDRIRVVSNTGQNLRLNPITGTVAATDMNLNPGMTSVDAAAYTNNFPGATATTLYDIDFSADNLYIQNPPNNGTLVSVGSLGVNTDAAAGFDIGGISGNAYAILSSGSETKLYSINLMTGSASIISSFPVKVNGFAIGLGF